MRRRNRRKHNTAQRAVQGGSTYAYTSIPEAILGHAPGLAPGDSVVEQTVFATGAKVAITQKSYYLQLTAERVVQRGSVGRTPSYWNIDLNAVYKPTWVKGVTLSANVFNVFNKQHTTSINEVGQDNNGASLAGSTYQIPTSFQQPRYVQLSAEYDFTL